MNRRSNLATLGLLIVPMCVPGDFRLAGQSSHGKSPTQTLPANRDELLQLFQKVREDNRGPLTEQEARNLIEQLGDDSFEIREAAQTRLVKTWFTPLKQLHRAAQHPDAEVRYRVRRILRRVNGRVNPLAKAMSQAAQRKLHLPLSELKWVLSRCELASVQTSARRLLLATVQPEDAPVFRGWLNGHNSLLRAAAVRVLYAVQGKEVLALLQKYVDHDEEVVRSAAMLALLDASSKHAREVNVEANWQKWTTSVNGEARLQVLRGVERWFRVANKERRKEKEVIEKYQQILAAYVQALEGTRGVTKQKHRRSGSSHWINLGLKTSDHPELLLYRVRWFNGQWSRWYVPGYNDRYVKPIPLPKRRLWANFRDHEHLTITTTREDLHREIMDLP